MLARRESSAFAVLPRRLVENFRMGGQLIYVVGTFDSAILQCFEQLFSDFEVALVLVKRLTVLIIAH